MESMKLADRFDPDANAVLFAGDCLDLLRSVPDGLVKLVVTSPPYNLGKSYENRLDIGEYLSLQRSVIEECVRVTSKNGSICWQVGNFVDNGEIVPLDLKLYPIFESLGLRLRNRVVWHFGHGLHASRRFSGRYEVILWFTRTNDYTFNLDAVRVPPKYPNKKHFKGPKAGQLSCNPLGKNPTDVWDIPNVKANHVEKTEHPCQFPVELVERLVLSLTNEEDWVLDPFMGVGSAQIAALIHGRRTIGADIEPRYVRIAESRIRAAEAGTLRIRPMERTVYDPSSPKESVPPKYVSLHNREDQMKLLERKTIFPSVSRGE
ncbi:MAG: site-specific DNA-methyltransferase [Armatimonadetes bacterium]|uniref:Methyltransferase n=1 Tax=Candidatus Nitrosymbiomonas proteolyticus TaxID=2608984 RepID=A0A809S6P7_9BACT|nr:site-specific DNA-methyltransferase [Armatimonadota bacterium]MCK6631939.1 site-specific DNA-methyltransferase [Fimbriimonadaceae bacterium]BBO24826.1 site-specific DNA-methyltransferase [Candidatus Nitrosymbiomonas proteolyticus]NOG39225.1 site-specific DNA-methyltransferase [Armatimonadota bacterium]NUM38557.1 site-specific DNA-methyltransferase [Armatimonadota bacterium]